MIITTFGATVQVEKSTAVTYPAVWLFVKNGGKDKPVKGAAQLNKTQAAELIRELQEFVDRD